MADNRIQLPRELISINETELRKLLTNLLTRIDTIENSNKILEDRVKALEDAN